MTNRSKKDMIKRKLMLLKFFHRIPCEFLINPASTIHWWIWWCPWNTNRPAAHFFGCSCDQVRRIKRVVLAVLHISETFWAQRFLVGICQNHPGIRCHSWQMTGMLMSWWGPSFVGNTWFSPMGALHFMQRWLLVVKIMRPFSRCLSWHGRNFMAFTVLKWRFKKNDIIRNLNFRLSHWLFMKHWCNQYNQWNDNEVTPAQPRTLNLPEIKPLQHQLKVFYEMNGLKPSEEHLYREAWGIKQATGFIKRKGRREEIPRETWL